MFSGQLNADITCDHIRVNKKYNIFSHLVETSEKEPELRLTSQLTKQKLFNTSDTALPPTASGS